MNEISKNLPRAVAKGTLGEDVDCYVLGPRPEDAILSKRGVVYMLTGKRSGDLYGYLAGLPEHRWSDLGIPLEQLRKASRKSGGGEVGQ
ncbi:MAG TPA: hypothetical protein PK095_15580, partial [Myxococcota bacterium]|nr:hypothetical protein [Myxococcota bacterium]